MMDLMSKYLLLAAEVADDDKPVVANRYQMVKKLGKGGFGTAFLVKDLKAKRPGDELKVLKEIVFSDRQPEEKEKVMEEAKLLAKLDHEGVLKFYDSFIDGEFFFIVTEYCEGGDLDVCMARMKKRGQMIPEKQVMDWTVELLLAVHYLHRRRVLHRDIKAGNIFLMNDHIKIGDFGVSRTLMGTADMAITCIGTPSYMSPEVLNSKEYNSKADVWSIGCVIFELCTYGRAFAGRSPKEVKQNVLSKECPPIPDKYSNGLQTLVKKILTKDPIERPSVDEILKMPFVSQHKMKMKLNPADVEGLGQADQDAQALGEAACANLHGNMTQKQRFQEQNKQFDPAPCTAGIGREKTLIIPKYDAFTVVQLLPRPETSPELTQLNEDWTIVFLKSSGILRNGSYSEESDGARCKKISGF